ncbi:MAG: hypothetical protein DME44_13430 [Verrucomicrobia bacterium]|nr:MAG: hypothetical protein DME44_13430 [Verrucomicrobiota bacterium]
MPSSTSNFKRILQLPRLFFRKPTEAESVHGGPPLEFERPIPQIPWRGMTVVVVLVVIAAAIAWEFYCRSIGYAPTLNNTEDLWAMARQRVQPESVVIIGDSRGWFDLDLDELQKGLGKRPVQLAGPGSCPYPVLADLTNDERKTFGALKPKRPRNASANIWRCHWKNTSHFLNNQISRSRSF